MKILKPLLVLSLFLNMSCTKEELAAIAAGATPTDGSQSAAQLAGQGQYCSVVSGIGGSYAVLKTLTLLADNTFTYYVHITDAGSCFSNEIAGGNNSSTFYMAGAWTVAGTNTTPSTATKVIMTVGSSNLIVYALAGGGQPEAAAMANFLNTCTPNPAYSNNTDNTKTLNGNSCGVNGLYAGVTFPTVGDTLNTIAYNDGSTLQVGLSTGEDLWRPGGTTFPSSYSNTFYSW